ncbi:hypothetical protein [Nocardia sp. NBC_00403]|uniref:hypothetical protein n=1 Tax=Nocardia sp. NBC_00403 TaxID=2975990 RepID=UPI002E20A9DB
MTNSDAVTGARLLADDIATALGYDVQTDDSAPAHLTEKADRAGGWISLRVPALDIEMGYGPAPAVTPDSVACQLATHIQDDILSRTSMIWPAYPGHDDQPLVPGDKGWYSESDPTVLVPYGHARSAQPRHRSRGCSPVVAGLLVRRTDRRQVW